MRRGTSWSLPLFPGPFLAYHEALPSSDFLVEVVLHIIFSVFNSVDPHKISKWLRKISA